MTDIDVSVVAGGVDGPVPDGGDTKPSPDAGSVPMVPVEFMGRTVVVKPPSPEQLVVINRLNVKFNDPETGKRTQKDPELALRLMDRMLSAICSLMVSPDDADWIEELWLTGKLDMESTVPLITKAVDALRDDADSGGNRADRRSKGRGGKKARAEIVTGA